MRLTFIFLGLVILMAGTSCKHKKKPVSTGEEPVLVSDFVHFFPPVKPPFQFSDSVFNKKEKDSLLINYDVFTQFVPDSVLHKVFGKSVKPRIYPMARIDDPKAETYLFAKAIAGEAKAVFVITFSKKKEFIAAMPILRRNPSPAVLQSVAMDKKYSLIRSVIRKNADGSISDGKDVYILNSAAKTFMLIMTDALDDKVTEMINPIDTMPRKNKLSADYAIGKMNMVSVRDGRKSDRIFFFIHFEQNNGECTGELKGEAKLRSANVAEFRENGDPCVLQFNFTPGSVTLKEEEGCGSHRGVRCSFNGTYPRKKYVKPAAAPVRAHK